MKAGTFVVLLCAAVLSLMPCGAAEPLKVFIRGGAKTHGPEGNGLHDHTRFLGEFTTLLNGRGAVVDGGLTFPTPEQLEKADVLLMFAADAGSIAGGERASLEKFLKRGGGIVCLHDAVCGNDAQWFKTIIGGAWEHGRSKWFEGPLSFYYTDRDHPIVSGASNFDIDDELYWDLHMMPEARILAGTWVPDRRNTREGRANPHIYEVAPQMWTYERTLEGGKPYRAFVSLLGHRYGTFQQPHHRAVLLRGIAWSAGREVDSLCTADELATLRYPEGGPTAPARAAAKLELHPEFKMSLAAAEPLVTKPISIDWDPQGRMWVAETPEYPNGRRGIRENFKGQEWKDHGGVVAKAGLQDRPAIDRISILTDSNHDGLMDTKQVWHEGLELVTGFVLYKDGVIASAAPDILWIRDRDHDGKSDEVVKLYTGLGASDTHAVINNLRWGMDGWIYATHGYSAGDVKSAVHNRAFGRIGSGVVRFRPDGSAFEQYSSKGGNTWGLDFSWDGDLFFTQPTSGDLLMTVLVPESVLGAVPGGRTTSYQVVIKSPDSHPLMTWEQMAYVQIDWVGKFTAAAGAAIYSGGSWPAAYNNSYFTTEPTINIVHHEEVRAAGAGYQGRKLRTEEFIGSRDLWFRPIETRIGPDGALYVLDFYNQAVIHNDTRGPVHNNVNAAVRPDRDHYFGRIWRIDHKDARALPPANLNPAAAETLMAGLSHPNRQVRMSAHRLLAERGNAEISRVVADANAPAVARVHALWIAEQLYGVEAGPLTAALKSGDLAVRKTAARIIAQAPASRTPQGELQQALIDAAKSSSPQVQLQALLALSHQAPSDEVASALVALFPSLKDPWLETAAQAAAAVSPLKVLKAAFASKDGDALSSLVVGLASGIASGKPEGAAQLVELVASSQDGNASLRQRAVESLARGLKGEAVPAWTDELKSAFKNLLSSPEKGLQLACLPLVARWDSKASLSDEARQVASGLMVRMKDASVSEADRSQTLTSLLGVRKLNAEILPAVASLLGGAEPASLQEGAIKALGETGDPAVGKLLSEAYPRLAPKLQDVAFNQLLKRTDSSTAFLDALKSGQVPYGLIGPAGLHRLRYHPDAGVAKKASEVLDALRGPEAKEKQALIAKLTPEVTQPGDVVKGKAIFTQNCATCHQFGEEGKAVGPTLTGMGAHGAAELLVHILDPNREVDPSFAAWNFETKEGESLDGIVVRENRTSLQVRNAAGETELRRDRIASQRNTGRSLMPEGFESLGGAGLRDLLAYMTAADSRYRVLDLRRAFTADSTKGIYISEAAVDETLKFKRFGMVQVGTVPFEILSPSRAPGGRNVTVLRGGQGLAKTFPKRVEIEAAGVTASRIHVLGGVAGWGFPCCGENKDLPVAKVTVQFRDGAPQEFVLRNGVEFADYNGTADVPGSKPAPDLVPRGQQVRSFALNLNRKAELRSVAIESYDNLVAPTFVAMTAEAGDVVAQPASKPVAAAPAPAPAPPVPMTWGPGVRTLLVGGGSSHDFNRWFNLADVATLKAQGGFSVNYTERYADVIPALPQIHVLGWSANQPQQDPALRSALLGYAASGKGLVLLHPGNWYIWGDWPEWNRVLVGGGARSHDRYGEFEVTITESSHPVMKGVPTTFKIQDELYHFQRDEQATPIQVLATGRNLATGKMYPLVWITKHPQSRVVNITLGHDGMSHDHPAYKQMLVNAITWAGSAPAPGRP